MSNSSIPAPAAPTSIGSTGCATIYRLPNAFAPPLRPRRKIRGSLPAGVVSLAARRAAAEPCAPSQPMSAVDAQLLRLAEMTVQRGIDPNITVAVERLRRALRSVFPCPSGA